MVAFPQERKAQGRRSFVPCSHARCAACLHQLVRTADELQPVDLVELGGHLAAEQPACQNKPKE